MESITVLVIAGLAALWWTSLRKGRSTLRPRQRSSSPSRSPSSTPASGSKHVIRQGKSVRADEVFEAWTSDDLEKMKKARSQKTNPIDRHFLLMGIVEKAYKKRSDPEMANLCSETAEQHIREFPDIAPPLRQDMDGSLPNVTTFQTYAKFLQERGEYSRAIEVCEEAMRYGLHDGTKSGFQGRVERIKKAREKAADA